MNETMKVATYTFGAFVILSLLSAGWNAYGKAQEKAELRKYCEQLEAVMLLAEQPADQLSDTDISAIYNAKMQHSLSCF